MRISGYFKLFVLTVTILLSSGICPSAAQLSEQMRVSNEEKILQLQEQIAGLSEDAVQERSEASLRLVYAYMEAGKAAMAREAAKKLDVFLNEPITEEMKAYLFYQVIDAHRADNEFSDVFETIETFRATAPPEAAKLRRYASSVALAKLYDSLEYYERAATLYEEIQIEEDYFDLKEFQRDRIALSMYLASLYARSEKFDLAYEAIRDAERHRVAYAPRVQNQYVFGIITLQIQTTLVEALVNLGRLDEAQEWIDKTLPEVVELERDATRDRLLFAQARIMIAREEIGSETLELLNQLVARAPEQQESHRFEELLQIRAQVNETLGQIAAALDDRKRAINIHAEEERTRNTSRSAFLTAEIDSKARKERLNELEISNKIATAEARRSRSIASLSVLIALLTFASLIGVYRAWRAQRSAREKLQSMNEHLKDLSDDNDKLANLDGLTGLPNRRNFIGQIDAMIEDRDATGQQFSVGLLDLDGFKLINDAYGHPCGDELLKQSAERLRAYMNGRATLARLGGDEFGFVYQTALSDAEINQLGRDICDALSRPYNLGHHTAKVAASIGIANFPKGGRTRSELFERADFALYHAKQNGKGHAVLFSAEHELGIRKKANLKLRLQEADFDREFTMHFQPIVDLRSKRPVGYEALARWNSPTLGPVSPSDFIPLAEEAGIMRSLTPVLLRKALSLGRALPSGAYMTFNLSTQDVTSRHYAGSLLKIVQEIEMDPHRLIFEITESAMLSEESVVIANLNRFRSEGIRIALDDFGDGFLSFNHLARLPLDILKLDKSCIKNLVADEKRGLSIIESICELCSKLGIDTVIEGVETEKELGTLSSIEIGYGQGYLFGRPSAIEELASQQNLSLGSEGTPVARRMAGRN